MPKKSTIRIISEGSGSRTQIYAVDENGTEVEIKSVTCASWKCDAHGVAEVELTILQPEINVIGSFDTQPLTKRIGKFIKKKKEQKTVLGVERREKEKSDESMDTN